MPPKTTDSLLREYKAVDKIRLIYEMFECPFIKKIDNALSNIIIVGHNPAFSEVSQKLSMNSAPALRTSCWTQLTFQTIKWSSIEHGTSISGSRKSLNV